MTKSILHSVCRLALLGVVPTAACSDGVTPEASLEIVRVEVTPPVAIVVQAGDSVRFTATAIRSDGGSADVAIRWSSTDGTVATVDGQGLAIGVGSGTTTIRAEAEGVEGSATFALDPDTVPPRLVSVTVDKTRVDILNKPGLVTVWVDLADDRTGVSEAIAQFQSPSGATITGVVALGLLSGTPGAGRYEGFLEVPANSAAGTWTLSEIWAQDAAGNVGLWPESALGERGLSVTFEAIWGGGG